MNHATTTSYLTTDPDNAIDLISDKAWKMRDEEVWNNNVLGLITPEATVLDAGCGLGRLLPRLWDAQKIVLAEPDPSRFAQAARVADALWRGDAALLEQLQNSDFYPQDSAGSASVGRAFAVGDKVHVLNTTMDDPAIAQHGPFDLILCSHVFEHIAFDVVQESLAAFHHFLKPSGRLVLFLAKGPLLYHIHVKKEFDHAQTLVSRDEYHRICQGGQEAGLGVRYLPFDLLETVLSNPFDPALKQVFGEEFIGQARQYAKTEGKLFDIQQWEAYHSHYVRHANAAGGTYVEHPQIQARLGLPIRPAETPEAVVQL
ncbi:MAG: class I SAM-dependent methyltransferase, partial [Candidatus Methylumidiphilus sp.]